jgi:hypothetical protein
MWGYAGRGDMRKGQGQLSTVGITSIVSEQIFVFELLFGVLAVQWLEVLVLR